ncbi:hypothetical protein JHN63_32240 [Streptomyces sp. MBT65]|uniref:hypothetical protein n=1 Tax=Streptomyces sp. MBT65 TaxID=1488395 RepID=UPI00190DA639|nr:hypothetical protein [Streptomyces sp. MBT65]MBK3578392.1 hypothetical protein [Streptomyces sp. MBT65]
MITVTDAASAARYGLQTARLRNSAGKFVAPTAASLTAAATSATGSPVAEITPAGATAKTAYPLAQLVYAAVRPGVLNAAARKDYAALLRYAIGGGQVSGADPGLLPGGYAPLPARFRTAAAHAATALVQYTGPSTAGGSTGNGAGSSSGSETIGTGEGSSGVVSGAPAGDATPPSASAVPSDSPSYDGGKAVQTTAAGTTPADPASPLRYAVPVGAALGAVAGVGAPFAGGGRLSLGTVQTAVRRLRARRGWPRLRGGAAD